VDGCAGPVRDDFEGGRGGHFVGKPNNNCQPDNLVAAARELGSTAQIPVLMIYTQNDTFFGPALSKRLYEAWTEAGGIAEYHLLAPRTGISLSTIPTLYLSGPRL
jgi:hypothetical protein